MRVVKVKDIIHVLELNLETNEAAGIVLDLLDYEFDITEESTTSIVRCKECKYYNGEGQCYRWHDELGFCEYVNADDFCSYGERRE